MPPASDDRRDPAIKAMDAMTRASLSGVGLYNVLSTRPVFNYRNYITVIMSAANPEVYSTWIRYDRSWNFFYTRVIHMCVFEMADIYYYDNYT